ncbi:unnamed protein product [Mytilus edulis]|uniref:Uncharacterized protein n=1 Tax=Mytilus edulis TaxID=6550 RepID=A0A8S3TA89_MYTED|nr:unnamed protein product [Mytilus edulis]
MYADQSTSHQSISPSADKTFTADIDDNVVLSWTTSMTEQFDVMEPYKSNIIYSVQFDKMISPNFREGKYLYDKTTNDVKALNITVMGVNKADAGIYRADGSTNKIVDGCCLLIITSVPINTTLTLQPEHPFVGDNITLTCSSTIQRWPKGYGTSHLSYQFHGNTRGATDNNELQIQKLIKSDKGTSIKCQATDDLRKVSNMSNTVTLDPFYGPENVVVEPEIGNVNVTEGTGLGPIRCNANCYPKSPPTKPTITLRPNIPFVGDNISLTCKSTAQRWPGNIPAHLSYQFSGNTRGESINNRLIMNNLTKLDKGTSISCQATDDLGKVSNMSKTVILDPYYGPENVVVEPEIRCVNVTEGTTLGPIHCIAKCNPECRYNWNQNISGNFEPVKNEFISKNDQSVHMHVPTITRNQAGTYRCQVDHPVVKGRSKIKDIIVNVQSPPTKPTITLRPNNPFVGDNISLTCKSTAQRWPGNIPAHLSYQFIGNTRGESNNNRLIMNNLTKLDKGRNITCQATDDLGKSVEHEKVCMLSNVADGPENVVVEPEIRYINVTEGTTLGPIHCIAKCNPECRYNWNQNISGNFEPVKNEFISNNNQSVHMHVPTITRNQAGTYRCQVDHPVVKGRSKIKDIIVNVQSLPTKPTITLRPNNPFVGYNISLTCKSTAQRWPGNIPAHLSYQFIGNKRGESNNNRLTMNNLTKLDKGTNITCQATDDLGKVSNMSKTVILDPYYGPENVVVKPAIRSLNVTEGSALGPIHCIANCNPECQYIWKQQMTGNFHPVKKEFISNNSVHVPTITRNQSGTYRCLVDHPEANNRTKIKNISVNVQYSPKITEIWLSSNNESYGLSTPTTYNFNEEVIVKMTLRMESNPDPQILFNSSLLKFKIINIKINGYIDYISNLPSLKCEDSGNYQILARNGIPYADTRTVSLKIYCKPRNATAKSGTIGTKVGTEENIVLNVISFPAPNVTWLRVTNFEWTILKERYNYKHKINSKIHIRTEEDFGVYGIKICNQLGCIVENITLKPQDKPETPKNFSVETATFRSLNISWIAGFNGGHEQTFSVHYKATDDFKWDKKNVQTSNIKTGSTLYYTLDQLKPDTSYQVTVVSKNIHGQRNASLEFKTEVEPTVKSPSKSASMTPIFIGIGCGSAVILMIVISLYMFFNRRNRGSTSEFTESNVLYAAVDKVQQKFKRRNSGEKHSIFILIPHVGNEDSKMSNEPANAEYASVVKPKSKSKKVHYKEDEIETANDEYAVVDKSNKKIDYTENDNVYANQGDADLLIHQPLKTKPSGRKYPSARKPKNPRVIIGAENRTNYVDIDFTRTADPLPDQDADE